MIPRSEAPYQNCFCEENIYHLLKLLEAKRKSSEDSKFFAVLISNNIQQIPLWSQKASVGTGRDFVIWDYHVIALEKKKNNGPDEKTVVYDMDTVLGWPEGFENYWEKTINPDFGLKEEYERIFRVIPVKTYHEIFSSDRKHMLKPDGSWMKPPPSWPMILSESGRKSTLMELIDMDKMIEGTDVMNEDQFFNEFCKTRV